MFTMSGPQLNVLNEVGGFKSWAKILGAGGVNSKKPFLKIHMPRWSWVAEEGSAGTVDWSATASHVEAK
jgi:hypothetical protein